MSEYNNFGLSNGHKKPRRIKNRRGVGGRRKTDRLPITDITTKLLIVIVFLINLFYTIVEILYKVAERQF